MVSNSTSRVQDTKFGTFDSEIATCEACNSTDIKHDTSGYVCRNCGLVLSELVMRYDRPYQDQVVQHAPLGKTQMGFYKERQIMARSDRMAALSRLDQERSTQERIKNKARFEINRILSAMGLPLTESNAIHKRFWNLYSKLQPGTKYRGVEKLVPITVYLYYKLGCKTLSKQKLLDISEITRKEFNHFMLQLRSYLPYYNKRNRKDLILRMIIATCEKYDLGMEFYETARKILLRFWEIFKSTKDSVIAGVCCSIVQLCFATEDITVSKLCDHLGIKMSTVHRQVEKKIFQRLNVVGFESLVRSADLLREVMVKLGIIESGEEIASISIIRVKLGNAARIFNANNTVEYYLYTIKTTSGSFLIVNEIPEYPEVWKNFSQIDPKGVSRKMEFSIQIAKYEYPRGPPELMVS
jgi:transcription initiation factor TFIIIB Brf1 subunit/transcription initiation factor TFIIB